MFVTLGRVPGGYAVRPLTGGKPFVVSARRIVKHKHEDFLARYSGMSPSARASAIAHTAHTRGEESLLDRAETKFHRSRYGPV